MGVHPQYDRETVIEEIVQRISNGETLRAICREEGKPHWTVIYDWLKENPEFNLRFTRARDIGHDAIAEECLQIADDKLGDWTLTDSGPTFDGDHVQRAKLKIETRLKLLAKWSPKKYGESTQLKHADADGNKLNLGSILNEISGATSGLPSPEGEAE